MMIPHTRTARILTAVIRNDASSIEALGRISPEHPLVRDGRAPSFLGIELGAQAAAALECGGSPPHSVRQGRLVRIREAQLLIDELPAGADLRVIAEVEGSAGPLTMLRIRVSVGDIEAVRASISTHQI